MNERFLNLSTGNKEIQQLQVKVIQIIFGLNVKIKKNIEVLLKELCQVLTMNFAE